MKKRQESGDGGSSHKQKQTSSTSGVDEANPKPPRSKRGRPKIRSNSMEPRDLINEAKKALKDFVYTVLEYEDLTEAIERNARKPTSPSNAEGRQAVIDKQDKYRKRIRIITDLIAGFCRNQYIDANVIARRKTVPTAVGILEKFLAGPVDMDVERLEKTARRRRTTKRGKRLAGLPLLGQMAADKHLKYCDHPQLNESIRNAVSSLAYQNLVGSRGMKINAWRRHYFPFPFEKECRQSESEKGSIPVPHECGCCGGAPVTLWLSRNGAGPWCDECIDKRIEDEVIRDLVPYLPGYKGPIVTQRVKDQLRKYARGPKKVAIEIVANHLGFCVPTIDRILRSKETVRKRLGVSAGPKKALSIVMESLALPPEAIVRVLELLEPYFNEPETSDSDS